MGLKRGYMERKTVGQAISKKIRMRIKYFVYFKNIKIKTLCVACGKRIKIRDNFIFQTIINAPMPHNEYPWVIQSLPIEETAYFVCKYGEICENFSLRNN